MENYFKISFPFVYTQHCKIFGAIYNREGGGGGDISSALNPSHEYIREGGWDGTFHLPLNPSHKKCSTIQNKILLAVKR